MRVRALLAVAVVHLGLGPATTTAQTEVDVAAPGTVVARECSPGERHTYRIALAAGDHLYAWVAQQGIDVTIRLVSPRGEILADLNEQKNISESERYALIAREGGDYAFLVLGSATAQVSGRYEAMIEIVTPAAMAAASRIAANERLFEAEKMRLLGTPDGRRAAQPKYIETVALWQAIGDPLKEARALHGLGMAARQLEEHAAALERLSEAAEAYRRAGNPVGEVQALAARCWSFEWQGEKGRATECLSDALARYRALGVRYGEASCLGDLGRIAMDTGNYPSALAYFYAAIPIVRERKDQTLEAAVLNNMGVTYERMGRHQDALEQYGRAMDVAKALNYIALERFLLNNVGEIHRTLGDLDTALRYFQDSHARFKGVPEPRYRAADAVVLSNIGRVYEMQGNYTAALQHLGMALTLSREAGERAAEAITQQKIGFVHEKQRDFKAALESHEEALRLSRSVEDNQRAADTLRSLGDVRQAQGEMDMALDLYNQALPIQRGIGDRKAEAATLYGLARAWREKGNLSEARADIEAALAIVEGLRGDIVSADLRAAYLGSTRDYYDLYIDILMRLGREAEAFQASERARARALLDTLVAARAVAGDAGDNNERNAALTRPQPLSLAEIQQRVLDEDTVLLEYALGEKRSFVWAVTRNRLTSHVLPGRAEIEAAARAVHQALTGQKLKTPTGTIPVSYRRAAATLGRMILVPVADELKHKRIVIVAEGALQYLPFGALPIPRSGPSFDPLITRHEVVHLPSASVLALLRSEESGRVPAKNTLAVLADPVFRSDDSRVTGTTKARPAAVGNVALLRSATQSGLSGFERLPETRREAQRIAGFAPPGHVLKAVDFEASRRTATDGSLAGHRIVHFATHGLLNSERPELSGLVLSLVDAQGRPQEGFLRLPDVYDLKLDADLVVLSACQTALGKDVRGEGLLGLTRGFMHAGAPRVVASLWRVNDLATAELMGRFYKKMLTGGLPAARALREAQLSMLQDPRWRSPHNWAGFVLQGEWR